jgi:hypothetical protein
MDGNKGFLVKAVDERFLVRALPEMAHMINDAMRTVDENHLRNKELNIPQDWVRVLTDVEADLLFPEIDKTQDVIFEVTIPDGLPTQDHLTLCFVNVKAVVQFNATIEFDGYGLSFPIQGQTGISLYSYCKAAGIPHYKPVNMERQY